jgi:hypothetical protein
MLSVLVLPLVATVIRAGGSGAASLRATSAPEEDDLA